MLDRFGVSPTNLLGEGGESAVYALDESRVLRVYKPGTRAEYVERRQAFYAWLEGRRFPYELPVVLEIGSDNGRLSTVERRMSGRVFADVLPTLAGDGRRQALASYLRAAERIGEVDLPSHAYGELLAPGDPLQRGTWPEYVWDRLQQAYHLSRENVEVDAPGVGAVLAHVEAELRALAGFSEKRLVHGDYFPGNVYVGDDLEVSGVGDFGYATVVGDPRLDLAGAIAFLEVVGGYEAEDTAYLTRLASGLHGVDNACWIDLYRLYYSFYFSTCRADDPPTYAWCIGNLRAWINERSGGSR